MKNLYDYNIPKEDEKFDTLFSNKDIKIVRIISSKIDSPKEFIQEDNEWVAVLEGEAVLEMKGKNYNLKKGDFLFIPANTPHILKSTKEGTLWLAFHWK